MSAKKSSILDYWPSIKDDLTGFLSDTDAWVITELKRAHKAKDWIKIAGIIDIMESVHKLSHAHQGE